MHRTVFGSFSGIIGLNRQLLREGDIGFFGFAVLVTFEIGFSVFAFKLPGFSVLVSTAVFGFSLFYIRVSVFMNKKAVIRFLRAIRALYEPF